MSALRRHLAMSHQGNAILIEFDSEEDATAAFDELCSPNDGRVYTDAEVAEARRLNRLAED